MTNKLRDIFHTRKVPAPRSPTEPAIGQTPPASGDPSLPPIRVVQGAVRGREIRMVMTAPRHSLIKLNAVARVGDRIVADWPIDVPKMDEETEETEETVRITCRLPLTSAVPPFDQITVEAGPAFHVSYGKDYFLHGMFPTDRHEFLLRTHHAQYRIREPETLVFSFWQLVNHADISPGDRMVIVVVLLYRLVDLGDRLRLERLLGRMESYLAPVKAIPVTGRGRTDGQHLFISGLTATWHAQLFLGKETELIATLDRVIDYFTSLPKRQFSFLGNALKAIGLRAMIASACGDRAMAKQLSDIGHALFLEVVGEITSNDIARYYDMIDAVKAGYVAMQVGNKPDLPAVGSQLRQWAPSVLRISRNSTVAYECIIQNLHRVMTRELAPISTDDGSE